MPLKWNFDETVTKCVVQLLMITVMKDLIDEHYDKLKEEVTTAYHTIVVLLTPSSISTKCDRFFKTLTILPDLSMSNYLFDTPFGKTVKILLRKSLSLVILYRLHERYEPFAWTSQTRKRSLSHSNTPIVPTVHVSAGRREKERVSR